MQARKLLRAGIKVLQALPRSPDDGRADALRARQMETFFQELSLARSYLGLQSGLCPSHEGRATSRNTREALNHLGRAYTTFLALPTSPKGHEAKQKTIAMFHDVQGLLLKGPTCEEQEKALGLVDHLWTIAGNITLAKDGCPSCALARRKPPAASPPPPAKTPSQDLPTTAETIQTLQERLGTELIEFQEDLLDACKIAGKPCDCCASKHPPHLVAMARELMPMDPANPVYQEIINWVKENRDKLTLEASASGQYDQWYVQEAAPKMREFRKQVMGTLTEAEHTKRG